ncbi:helix-turn-helix domain-containing protein [Streptomyces sp. NRRL B-1677]|uniref:helix-turn-helix domain-containing protein n=1 Tax=Streptomyces sp. NRRL B-1677 TaxID=2682966 RepID=UPI001892AE31|nr:helix-turn-helix domain-containing protein [Streptomyces sp. NRRL B-1677]
MDFLAQQFIPVSPFESVSGTHHQLRLLTAVEAAEMVNVKPSCIRQWVRRGYLQPTARNLKSGAWLYREDHILVTEKERRMKREPRRQLADQSVACPSMGYSAEMRQR